jgi:hypothetical protein
VKDYHARCVTDQFAAAAVVERQRQQHGLTGPRGNDDCGQQDRDLSIPARGAV